MSKRILTTPETQIAKRSKSAILNEKSFGISEYLGKTAPFHGILKHRFNDFHVYEVRNSEILRLKCTKESLKPEEEEKSLDQRAEAVAAELSQLDAQTLLEFLVSQSKEWKSPIIVEKEERTRFHEVIRKYFSDLLNTKTTKDNCILINKGKDKKRGWDGKEYCHFTLYKENRDTMDALNLLARNLRIPTNKLAFAGTKDKRGITVQRISAHKIKPNRLEGLNKNLNGIKLGDFTMESKPLSLADSEGNHFRIALREVDGTTENIENAINSLKSVGFINYFGMQRFGTRNIGTHEIGIEYLSKRYENACNLILAKQVDEKEDIAKAREIWHSTNDAEKALEAFPRNYTAERAILQSYIKAPKNYLVALKAIPRNLRLMYVHAYQSRVWNEMASIRFQKYKLEVVEGDLVLPITSAGDYSQSPTIVDSNNLEQFTIYDVVLPQPGHSVIYPQNDLLNEYQKFMERDGFNPNNMKDPSNHDLNLPGHYRHFVSKPQNVKWELIDYSDMESEPVSFILSDLEILQGKSKPNIVQGDKRALVIEFTLGTSQYATMALREVMKVSTSSDYHTNLSNKSTDH